MKKALVAALIAASTLFVAHVAAAASSNTLIKGTSFSSVYYYSNDGERYVFPNVKTFYSWYDNFSTVVTVSDTDLASIPIGGNVTYRPGKKLVKVQTDPKVYAVDRNGTLRWVMNEDVAKSLYGENWAQQVDDVPDIFFANYKLGAAIGSIADFTVASRLSLVQNIAADKIADGPSVPNLSPVPSPVLPGPPVIPVPEITRFEASKYEADLGDEVTITWDSKNTITCAISEVRDISIPFTGHLPNGSMTFRLVETGNLKRPTFKYYAICADKDWVTTIREFSIKIRTPQFTSEPTILSTYLSTPDQGIYWSMRMRLDFLNADAFGYNCSTDDPNDFIQNNRVQSSFNFAVPETGLKWGKTYSCVFNLQLIDPPSDLQNGKLMNLAVTKNFSFSTPEMPARQ